MVYEGTIAKDEVVEYFDGCVAHGEGEDGGDNPELIATSGGGIAGEPERKEGERKRDRHEVVAHDESHQGVEGRRFAYEAVQPKKYRRVHVRQ